MSTEVRFPVYFFAHVYIFFTCIYLLVVFLLLIFKRFVGILHFHCLRSATFSLYKGHSDSDSDSERESRGVGSNHFTFVLFRGRLHPHTRKWIVLRAPPPELCSTCRFVSSRRWTWRRWNESYNGRPRGICWVGPRRPSEAETGLPALRALTHQDISGVLPHSVVQAWIYGTRGTDHDWDKL